MFTIHVSTVQVVTGGRKLHSICTVGTGGCVQRRNGLLDVCICSDSLESSALLVLYSSYLHSRQVFWGGDSSVHSAEYTARTM